MKLMSFEQIKEHLIDNQYTWLITGAAGFIGSNISEQLLALNQKVIGLDNFFTGKKENIADIRSLNTNNFSFYEADIVDNEQCAEIFASHKIDFVLHHAALASVPLSIEKPKLACEVNINGFVNILDLAKNHKVKAFIYASSSAVYGDNNDLVKVEANIGNSLSPYATTKYTNELLARQYTTYFGMPTVGFRYFNIYGKRQDPNGAYAAVIPKWMNQIINNRPLYIYGDGTTTRDFCGVDEVVKINILACFNLYYDDKNNNKINSTVFNVGMGQELSLKALYDSMMTIAKKYNIKYSHPPVYQDFIKGDIKHSCANIDLARQELNFHPSANFYNELENLFNWISNHE